MTHPARQSLFIRTLAAAQLAIPRGFALSCALASTLLLGACNAARHTGPYSPVSDADRDTVKAERLCREAAEAMEHEPERAEALLREALTADLYHGPAHNNLGVLYLSQDKLYEAAGEFEWARKLLPGHPDPRMNLAMTFEAAGRTDEALAAYATALEVYPDHLPTMQALSRLQLRAGRPDDDTNHYLREIALRGESPEWKDWARLWLAKRGG